MKKLTNFFFGWCPNLESVELLQSRTKVEVKITYFVRSTVTVHLCHLGFPESSWTWQQWMLMFLAISAVKPFILFMLTPLKILGDLREMANADLMLTWHKWWIAYNSSSNTLLNIWTLSLFSNTTDVMRTNDPGENKTEVRLDYWCRKKSTWRRFMTWQKTCSDT